MAKELMFERVNAGSKRSKRSKESTIIGHKWLQRFQDRNPEIAKAWTRQMDRKRFEAINVESL